MADSEIEPSQSAENNETKPMTLGESFDVMCAYYLSIGVSYDEFWYGDYCRLKFYVAKHEKEIEMRNQELWLQGLYIYDAFSTVLGNMFGGKNAKKLKYMEKPMDILPKSEDQKKTEQEKAKQKLICQLNGISAHFKARQGVETNGRSK